MRRRAPFFTLLALSGAAAWPVSSAWAVDAETAAKINPFKPANTGGAAAPAANESVEFAGVSQVGKVTQLIIHDKTAKKSRWISVGETVEGISVLKYDPRLEQVVVKVNGAEKTLPLRKGSGPVNTPAPVASLPPAAGFAVPTPPPVGAAAAQPPQAMPLPAAAPADPSTQAAAKPAGPATPETQAKQETEARMLVSDLLEIGMAQRKAYEEAQRRAAEGKSQPAAAEGPPPAQPAK